MEQRLYSLREAARRTGYSVHALMEYVESGRISGCKKIRTLFGEEIRIPGKALEKLPPAGPQGKKEEAAPGTERDSHPTQEKAQENAIPPDVLVQRYEEAIFRAGWLEGQLESCKKQIAEVEGKAQNKVEEVGREEERLAAREREVEDRLSQARIIEAKYKEEKQEWEKRLAMQASKIREKERDYLQEKETREKKEEGLRTLKAKVESLTRAHESLKEEHELLLRERDELLEELRKAKKRWWKPGK